MAIKPKRIDPERARRAARGQWGVTSARSGTNPSKKPTVGSARSISSDSATSSGSSDDSGSNERNPSHWRGVRPRKANACKDSVSNASLTSSQIPKSDAESSTSDPELYRVARQRTVQLLFPRSEIAGTGKADNNREKSHTENEGRGAVGSAPLLGMAQLSVPQQVGGTHGAASPKYALHHRDDVTSCSINSTKDQSNTGCDSSGRSSPLASVETPLAVREALQGLGASEGSQTGREFDRLLEIFAEESKVGEKRKEYQSLSSVDHLPIDGSDNQSQPETARRMFAQPPRTFSELQERVLLSLYDAYQEGDGAEGDGDAGASTASNKYFIATDHMSEAFTLAALGAYKDTSIPAIHASLSTTSFPSTADPGVSLASAPCTFGAPLTLMDVVTAERARHNARSALERQQEEGISPSHRPGLEALFTADGDLLATAAEQALDRFHMSVRVLERAASNRKVVDELGNFLFEHHKLFLQGGGSGGASSSIREYPHEAFSVYERYSSCVSNFLLQLLRRQVPSFSMEEFVLTLYDVDLAGSSTGEYPEGGSDGSRDAHQTHCRSIDVLSYPAWRLLQSISSFDGFSSFMDDFIAEVYGVGVVTGPDDGKADGHEPRNGTSAEVRAFHKQVSSDVVVAAGARGIRALLARSDETAGRPLEVHRSETGASDNDPNLFTRNTFAATKRSQGTTPQALKRDIVRSDTVPVASGTRPSASVSLSGSTFLPTTPATPPTCCANPQRSSASSVQSFPRLHRRRPDAVPGRVLPPLDHTSEREEMSMTDQSREEEMEQNGNESLRSIKSEMKPSLTPPCKLTVGSATGVGGRSGRGSCSNPKVASVNRRNRSFTQGVREVNENVTTPPVKSRSLTRKKL